jgi:hypothetical protein
MVKDYQSQEREHVDRRSLALFEDRHEIANHCSLVGVFGDVARSSSRPRLVIVGHV